MTKRQIVSGDRGQSGTVHLIGQGLKIPGLVTAVGTRTFDFQFQGSRQVNALDLKEWQFERDTLGQVEILVPNQDGGGAESYPVLMVHGAGEQYWSVLLSHEDGKPYVVATDAITWGVRRALADLYDIVELTGD